MHHFHRPARLAAVTVMFAAVLALPNGGAEAAPDPWTYFEMTDGTKIAAAVRYPEGFVAGTDPDLPVIFQMDGYAGGGSQGMDPSRYGNRYITVHASIRGTGCSGGAFNLFDRRHAEDGFEIITEHVPALPGSNGEAAIIGHSYSGITGFLTASLNPPNLKAVAVSGLIDDLYRGIVYPGGVPNFGFPLIWAGGYRPASELAGNAERYAGETQAGDATCAANIATRPTHAAEQAQSVMDHPIANGINFEDGDWWRSRSTLSFVEGIHAPIHITQQYQDEQTGPRGGHVLFERISEDVPKRLVLTNGVHSTTSVAGNDRVAWFNCYVRGDASACAVAQDPQRVLLHFETTSGSAPPAGVADYSTSDWPAPETMWERFYLHDDGTLSTAEVPGEAGRSYAHATAGRQMTGDTGFGLGDDGIGRATFGDGPDQLRYELAIPPDGEPLTVAGPINLTLTASSTAPITDFLVDVLDVGPDGVVQYLQRGLQRSSHREINPDPSRSDYTAGGELYRAWHPHTNTLTKLLTPGTPERFEIEVFPVGWVFRPGHKLVLQLHAPPPSDPLSTYLWASGLPPAVNTVHHDPIGDLRASSILLPVLPFTPAIDAAAPPCQDVLGVPCFVPEAPDLGEAPTVGLPF